MESAHWFGKYLEGKIYRFYKIGNGIFYERNINTEKKQVHDIIVFMKMCKITILEIRVLKGLIIISKIMLTIIINLHNE